MNFDDLYANKLGLGSGSNLAQLAHVYAAAENYERVIDAAYGGREVRKLLEQFNEYERLIDACYGGREIRQFVESYPKIAGNSHGNLFETPPWIQGITDALTKLTLDQAHVERLINPAPYLHAWENLQSSLPWLGDFDQLDKVSRWLSSPSWERLIAETLDPISSLSYTALLERLARLERDAEPAEAPQSNTRAFDGVDWKFCLMLLLAILQTIRAEMLAAGADEKATESERRLTVAIQVVQQQLVAMHASLQEHTAVRWTPVHGYVQIRRDPVAGAAVVGVLEPGLTGKQLDHRGKWILLEVDSGNQRFVGWTLKKRLQRK